MGKNKRRQSAPVLPSKFDARLSEEIIDDDIYKAFGVEKNDSVDPKLETSTPRRNSKKKVKKRQSAPVKRMSIYDVLYEEEDKYEIPKGVFDPESPPVNEKKLVQPKSTGKPVEAKIPNLNDEPSLFDLLVSPRENKGIYCQQQKETKSKEPVANIGKPTLDGDEDISEPPSAQLPVLPDTLVRVRPISSNKRGKGTKKKVRSKSLVIDLGEPPMAVADSPESLSASDNQLTIRDEYLEIKPDCTTKKRKKIKKASLAIDLGDPPVAVAASANPDASDFVATLNDETLDISSSSTTKRCKNAKKSKSKGLNMDLGNPVVGKESMELLHGSDMVVPLNDGSLEIPKASKNDSSRDGLEQEIFPRRRCRSHSPYSRRNSIVNWGMNELHVIEESSEESDDYRWSSHSRDTPPHAPRKRTKRRKSCPPNQLWLDSFEATKTKKVKKKRKSKEKSVEKSVDTIKKSSAKQLSIAPDANHVDEIQKSTLRSSLETKEISKESKKRSPKKKCKSIRKDPNRMSLTSLDSSTDDSVEKPSSKSSLDSNTGSKGSRKESPKKKRKSRRKSAQKMDQSLHDSKEFAAAMVAAEEEARQKVNQELEKVRAEEEARRLAEQEAAAARLKLKVAEAQRKVEEEDQLRAKRKAQRQAKEGAMMRAREEARRNAEMEGERQRLIAEQERLQQETAKFQRLRKAEQDRLEKERAELQRQKEEEAERLVRERADLERRRCEEEQRLQREWEKQERQLLEEKARIKARHEATKARLEAKQQENDRLAKEEKLRLKAEKQERDRLAKEEKARIKAEKDAELARIKAEKDAEKVRIKAEKEDEKARIRLEEVERQRVEEAEKARIEAEKEAEMKRQKEEADQKKQQEQPLKLPKPSLVDRNYSIDSLFQGSIDNSLHAETEAQRLIKDRQQLEREKANLERQKKAAAARLRRRAEAIRNAVRVEKAKPVDLDVEIDGTQERSEEEECTSRRKEPIAKEQRERAPSPEAGEKENQRARKEVSIRKKEKRRTGRTEEKVAGDYRLGKLDGRRSIAKNDRQFGSSWNKIVIS